MLGDISVADEIYIVCGLSECSDNAATPIIREILLFEKIAATTVVTAFLQKLLK